MTQVGLWKHSIHCEADLSQESIYHLASVQFLRNPRPLKGAVMVFWSPCEIAFKCCISKEFEHFLSLIV